MMGIVVGEPVKMDSLPLEYEIEKRNAELGRVRKYLKSKGQKTEFERFLQMHYDYFYEKAIQTAEQLAAEDTASWCKEIEDMQSYCHGDYQYHNILMDDTGCQIINFEKMTQDNPVKDLYLFTRKLLEKNNWDLVLGRELLHTYNEVRTLRDEDLLQLKYRFLYPEKFWKIVNYYFNSSKAWISCKNTEKLETILQQEDNRNTLIQTMFS
jgi:CotS family spore coat protein